MKAQKFLDKAKATLAERGGQYESGEEENSMREIIELERALCGADLDELEGWYFMLALKLVRLRKSIEQGKASEDSIVDLLGYTAKLGECLFPEGEFVVPPERYPDAEKGPDAVIVGCPPQFDSTNFATAPCCAHEDTTLHIQEEGLRIYCDDCGCHMSVSEYLRGR